MPSKNLITEKGPKAENLRILTVWKEEGKRSSNTEARNGKNVAAVHRKAVSERRDRTEDTGT